MNRELRTGLAVTVVFLTCVAAGLCLYVFFGHRVLTAVHSGESIPLLERLAGNRGGLPLRAYLDKADRLMVVYTARALASFFFYLFFVLAIRYLLRKDSESVCGGRQPSTGVRASEVAGASLIYALLTIAFFYRIIPHIDSQLIGPPEDNMQSLWRMWMTRQALQEKPDLIHTSHVFYPEGASQLFSLCPYSQLFALAATGTQSLVAVYNLLILSTFVFSGIGAFLLIRHFTDDTAAALLGGFVFAFNPSHFAHSLHHVSIATAQFIPFFVLFYIKTTEDGSRWNVAWASAFFLLNALCCWDYMIYALFFMVVYYFITAYRRRRFLMPGLVISSLIIVCTTLAVLSPLIIGMLASAARHPNVWFGGHDTLTIDLLGLFVPHYRHWLAGVLPIARANASYSSDFAWESVGYLGIICVGLLLASSPDGAGRTICAGTAALSGAFFRHDPSLHGPDCRRCSALCTDQAHPGCFGRARARENNGLCLPLSGCACRHRIQLPAPRGIPPQKKVARGAVGAGNMRRFLVAVARDNAGATSARLHGDSEAGTDY
ncbi:hypothetical protein FJY68_13060 [candidate division WOR-3 bacterium]|uniref:DUF6311 domain-containing protein n=1 Tax=candidate division WOR-3 bacterium TaxID=2052148 RepID=A0A937XK12_UNCW3|nr:hypothetical protein [candidate division WOR-3 bacterium]